MRGFGDKRRWKDGSLSPCAMPRPFFDTALDVGLRALRSALLLLALGAFVLFVRTLLGA